MKKPILIGGGVVLMAVLIAGGIYLLVPNIPQATSVVGTTDTPEVSPMIKILTSSDIPTIAPTDLRTYTSPEKDISFNYQSKLG